ncbi:hypothetical protein T492DRAFT_166814 [Pavlovales sp. CCMP2436]|nr:hypothetical protein T492DRAFT_166814 [Pavlovales sp. CCMP2436]
MAKLAAEIVDVDDVRPRALPPATPTVEALTNMLGDAGGVPVAAQSDGGGAEGAEEAATRLLCDALRDVTMEVRNRLFADQWEHRHGAAAAARVLLLDECPHPQESEDWAARLLSLIALDRFVDYSGARAVAPVAAVAGQALGALCSVAPATLLPEVVCRLRLLVAWQGGDRHGGGGSRLRVCHAALVAAQLPPPPTFCALPIPVCAPPVSALPTPVLSEEGRWGRLLCPCGHWGSGQWGRLLCPCAEDCCCYCHCGHWGCGHWGYGHWGRGHWGCGEGAGREKGTGGSNGGGGGRGGIWLPSSAPPPRQC